MESKIIDLTPDAIEQNAIDDAINRLEILGFGKCHTKKPSNNRRVKVLACGRGKTIHIDTNSNLWKDYKSGKITLKTLKYGETYKKKIVPVVRENPAWMEKLIMQAKNKAIREMLKNS